jgi:hypothetical protein
MFILITIWWERHLAAIFEYFMQGQGKKRFPVPARNTALRQKLKFYFKVQFLTNFASGQHQNKRDRSKSHDGAHKIGGAQAD